MNKQNSRSSREDKQLPQSSGHAPLREKMDLMEKQGYRFIGKNKHSAVKVCEWCREALRGNRICYKEQFYEKEDNVKSHQCIQFTPVAFHCTHNCKFCWRIGSFQLPPKDFEWDNPKELVDEAIEAHKELLQGFGGAKRVNKKKFQEAMTPKQFAISLTGEPTLYPYLPELVQEIRSRGISAYVVSNGTQPEMIQKLVKVQPTKMYITLPAPNEDVYEKICYPIEDSWKKLLQSLALLRQFKSSVIRLTLVKELNMINPEEYAKIIQKAKPNYVEFKAFMSIGGARKRLPITSMPSHSQVHQFAEQVLKHLDGYKIIGEKEDSRVVVIRG